MFFLFSFGFMSTLNRKISIRISAAINLFLDCFTMLRVPACPAVATPAQLVPQRMCQTLCVRAKAQPHGTTWGPRHAEKMPGCWSAVRADSGTALLPILRLGDFTLAKCSILLQVTACSESTNAAHRGSKQLWVTFAKLLQPTFETDEWNTSSIFSNIRDIWKETRRTAYGPVDQPIISAQLFPPQTGFALFCSIKIMDSFPVAINSDTSQDKASFRPSIKHSKQHNRNDCFNIGQNWTCFQISQNLLVSEECITLLFSPGITQQWWG